VVEHLPSKCEAISSDPNTLKEPTQPKKIDYPGRPNLIIGKFFFVVLGFELRTNALSHSTSPFICVGFVFLRYGLSNYLPRLASNHNPPDLCFLSS
jgi:hypothetical protein